MKHILSIDFEIFMDNLYLQRIKGIKISEVRKHDRYSKMV